MKVSSVQFYMRMTLNFFFSTWRKRRTCSRTRRKEARKISRSKDASRKFKGNTATWITVQEAGSKWEQIYNVGSWRTLKIKNRVFRTEFPVLPIRWTLTRIIFRQFRCKVSSTFLTRDIYTVEMWFKFFSTFCCGFSKSVSLLVLTDWVINYDSSNSPFTSCPTWQAITIMCVLVFSSSHFTLGPYSIRFVQRGAVKKAYHALISPNMPLRLPYGL